MRKIIAGAALIAAAAALTAGLGLAACGGSGLTASPAKIQKDLVGYVTGSPLPIYTVKHVTVNGTPKDNGTTETADVTITWGFVPNVSGPYTAPEHATFTLNDKTGTW